MSEDPQDDITVVRGGDDDTRKAAPVNPPQAESLRRQQQPRTDHVPDLESAMRAMPGAMQGNALVRAATPLLLLAVQLRHSTRAPDIAALREGCMARLHRFEEDVRHHGVDTKTAMAARYVLCTVLDEAVLASPWGDASGWSQRTLLVAFHGETYGGAKVFDLLDRLARDPARHLDLLELIYMAMALGFGGKYLVEPGGLSRLADRQTELYRLIRRQRAAASAELSPHWAGADVPLSADATMMPFWIASLASLCILLLVFLFLYTRLDRMASPVYAQLAKIGLDRVPLPSRQGVPLPNLQGTLVPEQRAGLLTLTVGDDGSSTIRIAGSAMFASGSADVDPKQNALLNRIADELNKIPGRIAVVGHTDDQPIRSARFKDNMELSSRRAESVGRILATSLKDPRRVETVGAGESQPIATPVETPENRARNRRVEIVLIPEA